MDRGISNPHGENIPCLCPPVFSLGFRSCALVFRCASLATDAGAGLQVCALVAAPLELLVLDVRC